MNSFSNILKKGLLLIVFSVMLLPMIQDKFNFIELPALKGDVKYPSDSVINKSKWFSARYQEEKETYLNSMFGLRSLFVRLHNQISYSCFNKANANGVVIGKEHYLYEQGYIDAYTGKDFLGEDSITHTLNKLKFISDTLNKLNKQLIIVFAPGKASYYPEFIPDNYLPVLQSTNYKSFSDGAKKHGLETIDFNKWFMDNKNKSKHPLYPKYGIHWSIYGCAIAADSIIRKIEDLRHINAPHFYFKTVSLEKPKDIDYDMADGMNLLFKLSSFKNAYPNMIIEDSIGKTKPRVLTISDSFYWGMYNMQISKCFSNHHFWYYNKMVYPESFKQELVTDQLDLELEIKNHDVIILMATEANLKNIGWGSIQNLTKLFTGNYVSANKQKELKNKILGYIDLIKKDSQWLSDSKMRAKEKNITLDSMLVLEALWQINQKEKKKSN